MNDGMKIILERMKTHPEEFKKTDKNPFLHNNKWLGLVSEYGDNLPEEDMEAFKEALNVMKQEEFTAKVMEELLDPKSDQLELDLKSAMPSVGQTLASSITNAKSWVTAGVLTSNTNSLTLGSTTIDESHLEHMKAHVEALQVKDRDKLLKKPSKTIFGKLFNYT